MRKVLIGSTLLLGLLLLTAPVFSADMHMRQKLAVFPFMSKNMDALTYTESISSILLSNVEGAGYFDILERKKTEGIIELEGIRIDELTREGLFRIGSKSGVDFTLTGSLTRVGSSLALELELLSIRSKKTCASDTFRFTEAELSDKMRDTAKVLVKKARECMAVESTGGAPQKSVGVPEGLRASGSTKSIRLSWSHPEPSRVIGYKVFRSNTESGNYTQMATTTEGAFVDDNLQLNETFFYKVKAVGKTGAEGPFSSVVMGRTSIAPGAPILLSVKGDIKSVHLQWRSRPGGKSGETEEAWYRIYRKTPQDKDYKEIVTITPVENNIYTDTKLKDKTIYVYAITALNTLKTESDLSSSLDAATVTGVGSAVAESGKIRRVPIKWEAHISDVVEGYRIYRSAEKDGEYRRIKEVQDRLTATFTDRDLEDKKTYWYRITAYNKSNAETDPTAPVSAVTRGRPPTPAGLKTVSREPRRVSMSWTLLNSPDDEIKGYRIYRSVQENAEFVRIGETEADRGSFVDSDTPLKDDATYYYRITSVNSAGVESEASVSVSAVTKPAPKAPSGVKASSGDIKKVTVSWDRNPEPDVKEYLIFRKQDGEREFDKIKTVRGETSYPDQDLKDGVQYSYRIQVVDNDKLASALSESVTARTKPLPVRPSGVKATGRTLSWDPNPEKDVKLYNVYRKSFLGAQKLAAVSSSSWTIEGLKDKVELFITAQDDSGLESEPSDTVPVDVK